MAIKKTPGSVPPCVKACLWFANTDQLDWNGQKEIIITSILNRGTWEAVRWAYRFYGEDSLREVVTEPKRGSWFSKSLCFWMNYFNVKQESHHFKEALIHL